MTGSAVRNSSGTATSVNTSKSPDPLHGYLDEAARAARDFRAVPVVHRSGAPASVQGVPFVHHVLLRVRVLLRAVRVGP